LIAEVLLVLATVVERQAQQLMISKNWKTQTKANVLQMVQTALEMGSSTLTMCMRVEQMVMGPFLHEGGSSNNLSSFRLEHPSWPHEVEKMHPTMRTTKTVKKVTRWAKEALSKDSEVNRKDQNLLV
jgi:hypothetical protein